MEGYPFVRNSELLPHEWKSTYRLASPELSVLTFRWKVSSYGSVASMLNTVFLRGRLTWIVTFEVPGTTGTRLLSRSSKSLRMQFHKLESYLLTVVSFTYSANGFESCGNTKTIGVGSVKLTTGEPVQVIDTSSD